MFANPKSVPRSPRAFLAVVLAGADAARSATAASRELPTERVELAARVAEVDGGQDEHAQAQRRPREELKPAHRVLIGRVVGVVSGGVVVDYEE